MSFLTLKEMFTIPHYLKATDISTGQVEFDNSLCFRCSICAQICPARSILMDPEIKGKKGRLPVLGEPAPGVTLCISCGCCLAACPEDAIKIIRGFRASGFFKRLSQGEKLTFPQQY